MNFSLSIPNNIKENIQIYIHNHVHSYSLYKYVHTNTK